MANCRANLLTPDEARESRRRAACRYFPVRPGTRVGFQGRPGGSSAKTVPSRKQDLPLPSGQIIEAVASESRGGRRPPIEVPIGTNAYDVF
jgi:hypothetical protein